MNTIFAKSVPGRCACRQESDAPRAADMLPPALLRARPPRLPQCSELDVVRHFTELSQRNYSVDANFYPLGSCTMKYNPKFTEYVAALPGFSRLHPLLAQSGRGAACVQGALQCLYEAEALLCEVTGMRAFTFQPMAGANGEFTGVKLIAAYHKAKGRNRKKMLIPDAAHGTNPASAALAGFEAVNLVSRDGMVDPEAVAACSRTRRRSGGHHDDLPQHPGPYGNPSAPYCGAAARGGCPAVLRRRQYERHSGQDARGRRGF